MQTLMIQYQIGQQPPSWYPLWTAERLSDEEVEQQLAQARASHGSFSNILQHQVVSDGLTEEQYLARERESERAERNRCDAAYAYDVRFGDDAWN